MSHQVPMYCDDTTSPPTLWGWDWMCDILLCAISDPSGGNVYVEYPYDDPVCGDGSGTFIYYVCRFDADYYYVNLPDCCTNNCTDCSCNDEGENQFVYQIKFTLAIYECKYVGGTYIWDQIVDADQDEWTEMTENPIDGPPARCIWDYDISGYDFGLLYIEFDPCGDDVRVTGNGGYFCGGGGDIRQTLDLNGCGEGAIIDASFATEDCVCESGTVGAKHVEFTCQIRRYGPSI